MITILHSTNTRDSGCFTPAGEDRIGFRFTEADARKLYTEGGYEFVGLLDTDDLDDAWDRTQNGCPAFNNSSWIKGDKINMLSNDVEKIGGARSSMVGDIFGDSDDNYYIVSGCGFTKLGKLPHPAEVMG